jgi:lipopolysaccharide export system protein LptC
MLNLKIYIVVGLLLAVMILGYELDLFQRQAGLRPRSGGRLPDYTLEKVTLTSLNNTGKARYRIDSPEMAHFVDDGSTELKSPVLLIFRDNAPPVEVQSERAWIAPNSSEILLIGEVTIVRPENDVRLAYTIVTRDLHVFPDQETATTEQSVLAFNDTYQITGLGGNINFTTGMLKIHHLARGVYVP